MIENIIPYEKLVGLARKKNKKLITKIIPRDDLQKAESQGWTIEKQLKNGIQVKTEKPHQNSLQDRVWTLFYRMKFSYLSSEDGGLLIVKSKEQESRKPIPIVAIDKEVAIAIQCKSFSEYKKWPLLQEELAKVIEMKEGFSKSIRGFSSIQDIKRQLVYILVTNKVILNDEDREAAKKANVILFDEKDLSYYENLINHLGPAAKYQVLADMLPGKVIPGLSIRIPAIKTKMGGFNCYTFSISPEYLLKVSYVSHRSKGKASDINTYQRMLAKGRLKKIKEYISDDGIFPTNIILNFEKDRLTFQRVKQETESEDLDLGILGWLDIKPAYKSAWIVDGQHRLFAYSGHGKALKSKLSVLAFEGLQPSKQAELFIEINAKQKSVKQSLLQELFAELHWDAEEPTIRISAIISKAIQDLNTDPECSLYQRIQTTDGPKDHIRCITLTSLFGQIEKKGFFIITKEKSGNILEYGPLWGGDDNAITLKRAITIIKFWLNTISLTNKAWWDIGSGPGGGLSMNDGIATLIAILRSVFEDLEKKGHKLNLSKNNELCNLLKPYAEALGGYLFSLNELGKKAFRDLRGESGISHRMRQCQQGMRNFISDFHPEGLDKWIALQKQETNKITKDLIDKIEISLQGFIVEELKTQYGINEEKWWYDGVPSTIRTKVTNRMEDEKNKRGGKEFYFDLIDYKKIIVENWAIFEDVFAFGKGNKEKRTEWIDFANETRKIVAHASSGKTVSTEDCNKVKEYSDWLERQINSTILIEQEDSESQEE